MLKLGYLWWLVLRVYLSFSGFGLLPQYGNYAQRCEATQCNDRPWTQKGTAHLLLVSAIVTPSHSASQIGWIMMSSNQKFEFAVVKEKNCSLLWHQARLTKIEFKSLQIACSLCQRWCEMLSESQIMIMNHSSISQLTEITYWFVSVCVFCRLAASDRLGLSRVLSS